MDEQIISLYDILQQLRRHIKLFLVLFVCMVLITIFFVWRYQPKSNVTQIILMPYYYTQNGRNPIIPPNTLRVYLETQVQSQVLSKLKNKQSQHLASAIFKKIDQSFKSNSSKINDESSLYLRLAIATSRTNLARITLIYKNIVLAVNDAISGLVKQSINYIHLRRELLYIQKQKLEKAFLTKQQNLNPASIKDATIEASTITDLALEQRNRQQQILTLQSQINQLNLTLKTLIKTASPITAVIKSQTPVSIGRLTLFVLGLILSLMLSGIIVLLPLCFRKPSNP